MPQHLAVVRRIDERLEVLRDAVELNRAAVCRAVFGAAQLFSRQTRRAYDAVSQTVVADADGGAGRTQESRNPVS